MALNASFHLVVVVIFISGTASTVVAQAYCAGVDGDGVHDVGRREARCVSPHGTCKVQCQPDCSAPGGEIGRACVGKEC